MANILIAEDEEILRDLMSDELEKRGHTVHRAMNGQEALDLIEKDKVRPDIILLDLLMPVMSGYDFLMKFHESIEFAGVPCIVLSNSGQVDDLNRAFECGADDVLIKADFTPHQLVEKVEHRLKESQS